MGSSARRRRAGAADYVSQELCRQGARRAAAVKAGINNFLDTYKPDLAKALKDGLLTEADMDASLHNELRVFLRLGEFDAPGVDPYGEIGRKTEGRCLRGNSTQARRWRGLRRTSRWCC